MPPSTLLMLPQKRPCSLSRLKIKSQVRDVYKIYIDISIFWEEWVFEWVFILEREGEWVCGLKGVCAKL